MNRRLLGLVGSIMVLVFAAFAWSQSQESESQSEPRVRVFRSGMGGSYLGIVPQEVDADVVERLGLREERGALVAEVVEDSPAAEAGLQIDDVILFWNRTAVESTMQLRRLIRETPEGRSVTLGIMRDGAEQDLEVMLGSSKEMGWRFAPEWRDEWRHHWRDFGKDLKENLRDNLGENLREYIEEWRDWNLDHRRHREAGPPTAWLGVTLQSLTPQLADYFGLRDDSGALVSSVADDSPAAAAGLRAGDVIVAVDGETIDGPSQVSRLIRRHGAGAVNIDIVRDGREQTVTATLEERRRGEGRYRYRFELDDDDVNSIKLRLRDLPRRLHLDNIIDPLILGLPPIPEIPEFVVFEKADVSTI